MSSDLKIIYKEELLKNDGNDGKPLWILIHGKIYDITGFEHPGGPCVFENWNAPNDVTDLGEDFDEAHDEKVIEIREKYLIGLLGKENVIKEEKEIKCKSDNRLVVLVCSCLVLLLGLVWIRLS